MTMPQDLQEILPLLAARTKAKDIKWRPIGDGSELVAQIGVATITIDKWDHSGQQLAEIVVRNADQHPIQKYRVASSGLGYKQISDLYDTAYESVYRAQETMQSLLSMLRTKQVSRFKTGDVSAHGGRFQFDGFVNSIQALVTSITDKPILVLKPGESFPTGPSSAPCYWKSVS